ncbi:MAG: sugar phosphate isomerase/epimerase [Clostridia bacterium]|nr:sugar phosphate isomerase/epimerase [Clostridia bacterium]
MKTCVSSYSFSNYMRKTGANQKDIISIAAKMGFDAIEFTDLSAPEGMTEMEFAQILREESEKCGIPIVNYTIGADFLNCEDFDAEVKRVCLKADVAKALGATGMRHDATVGYKDDRKKYSSFDTALPTLVKGCKAVTDYAKTIGIETMVENHGQFCQESARVERLMGGVNDPNFGWLVDIGNFLCADDEPIKAVGVAAPFAKHVHVKDFHVKSGSEFDPGKNFFTTRAGTYLRGAILGQGNVPVYQCLKTIKRSGYDGYVSIEFEGIEDNLSALETGLENLNKMIKSL